MDEKETIRIMIIIDLLTILLILMENFTLCKEN